MGAGEPACRRQVLHAVQCDLLRKLVHGAVDIGPIVGLFGRVILAVDVNVDVVAPRDGFARRVARHACVRSLGALTDAARIFNSIGKPVTTMIGDEQLLMISCGDCGEAITSEMRTEAEIIEDVDGFYEIEKDHHGQRRT